MAFNLKMNKFILSLLILCLTNLEASNLEGDNAYEKIPTNVLIIENDPISTIKLQYMIINYFEDRFDSEPKFIVKKTGKGGKLAFDLFQPDLIFVDCKFPDEVTGIEVVTHIRQMKKHPVKIFARSHDMMGSMIMYRYGADIIMKSTIEMEELEAVLDYTFFAVPFKPIATKPKGLISKLIKKRFK